MNEKTLIKRLFSKAAELQTISNAYKHQYQIERHYGKVDFKQKKVIDIGGGYGLISMYAACRGASEVVCIEPELSGSSNKTSITFETIKDELDIDNIKYIKNTIQKYSDTNKYDIVILSNSINHLDEDSCINMLSNKDAYNKYEKISNRISELTADNGLLIFSDCSNRNFYGDLNITNPFAKTIEWNKHQSPNTWVKLFEKAGFEKNIINWSSYTRLGLVGKVLFSNKFIAYFMSSHFYVYMNKT